MGRVSFVVQELDGYTDGRESWRKVSSARTRSDAEEKMSEARRQRPHRKFRIRQIRQPERGRRP